MKKAELPQPLRGIIPPIITPLLARDTLDKAGLAKLVEHILGGGVHGIFILGTTGELSSLSYRVRHEMVESTCEWVAGRVPVLVGITDTALPESIQLAQTAEKCGAAAVVAAAPYYFSLNQAELTSYYQHLADQLPLPLFLYNMPSHTKISLAPKSVKILAQHPHIVGIKDSSGNGVNFQLLHYQLKDEPDFSLLVGPEELTAEVVLLGAHGGINGGANLFPRLYVDLYEAAVNRDLDRLLPLHQRVLQISTHLYSVGNSQASYLQGVKCALSLMGICRNILAEPLQPFGEKEQKIIRQHLQEIQAALNTKVPV
ncbi:dihydrodipicolinate synthase family protein [Adhaeribacter arboris]|uniref:Dihydrodipicolinate synthase family protein n=1 Tax=Adhaeribacter arboris TaxID=2072846 RepID=A0A2T2YCH8_9BACT|nr:dihydrodipicolinate synthase family protein [Adhaeribacter arboris]PSR53204.1 dihydrodipicolinate synthase family protein [Adhaeribacter arboris]